MPDEAFTYSFTGDPIASPTKGKALQGFYSSSTLTVNQGAASSNRSPVWSNLYVSGPNVPDVSLFPGIGGEYSALTMLVTANSYVPTTSGRVWVAFTNGSVGLPNQVPSDGFTGLYTSNGIFTYTSSGRLYTATLAGAGTGSATYRGGTWSLRSTGTYHYCVNCAQGGALGTASATRYMRMFGTSETLTAATDAYLYVYEDTYFFEVQIYVATNARVSDTTFGVYADGVEVLTCTVGAGLTGFFSSTGYSVLIPAGSLVCFRRVNGTGTGALTPQFIGVVSENRVSASNGVWARCAVAAGTANSKYMPLTSHMGTGVGQNESYNQNRSRYNFQVTVSELRVRVSANTGNVSSIVRLRVNNVASTLSLTIPATTTGWFVASGIEVDLNGNDVVVTEVIGPVANGGTGSITIQSVGYLNRYRGG